MKFYKLAIKEIIRETPDAVSIEFNIPEELKSIYTFKSGQYITLKLTLNSEKLRRSYSICSTPESGKLKVTVKAIKGGKFSNFANNELKTGQILEVSSPEGHFVYPTETAQSGNFLAFAAGSGITPIMSIIKTVLSQQEGTKFVLMYSNKSIDQTIFYKELLDLENRYPNRFFYYNTFTETKPESDALFGRIDQSKINYIVKNKHQNDQLKNVYICGPEAMVNLINTTLLEQGFKEENIHHELFFSKLDKDQTRPENNSSHEQTNITVILDDEHSQLNASFNDIVLDTLLNNGLDAPYSCQGGVCSSCICRVTKGKVHLIKNTVLTDSELEEGLILACQALPRSEHLEIDFDDI